jgi:hypothetical protein
MTSEYRTALEHWAKQFRNGNLSDQFADEIAYLLEDKAHDLKMDEEKTFNHAYDFAFEVVSNKEDASDVTATMLREACINRINEICDEELLETCGIYDTKETNQ